MNAAGSTTEERIGAGPSVEWGAVQRSADFVELRRRRRLFTFPLTGLFLVWYVGFILLAAYAHDLMATKLIGNINLGLVLGLLQFASTFLITLGYVAFANRRLDPLTARVRAAEGEA